MSVCGAQGLATGQEQTATSAAGRVPAVGLRIGSGAVNRLADNVVTRTHPWGPSGSGRSPIFSAESGSSGAACVA